MKNLKFLLIAVSFLAIFAFKPEESKAQFVNFTLSKTSTSSGADTVTGNIIYPFSTVGSMTVSVTKSSGTLAGTIYLYGSNIGNTYTLLDSATVTNTSGTKDYDFTGALQSKLAQPYFYRYRFVYYQTNGVASLIRGYALTRGSTR